MERASISQIKNHLSSYLKKVRAGQTILVLDRDQPVARIEPAAIADDPQGRVAALAGQGVLKLPTQPLPFRMLKSAPRIRAGVLEALLEERRTGR